MIYLIAQMLVPLFLAGILGASLGWLIHRAAHVRQLDYTKHALARAQNQLAHTQSEVTMLSDEYDELQQRSKAELSSLRKQINQIPALTTNLEKSQLLVRQLMQQHESKVRELTTEISALSAKLKVISDREQAYDKVKVELDNIRKQKAREELPAANSGKSNDVTDASADVSPTAITSDPIVSENSTTAAGLNEPTSNEAAELASKDKVPGPADNFINQLNEATRLPVSDARSPGSWASAPLTITTQTTEQVQKDETSVAAASQPASSAKSENADTPEPASHGDDDKETLEAKSNQSADSLEKTSLVGDDNSTDDQEPVTRASDVNVVDTREQANRAEDDGEDPFDNVMEVGEELRRDLVDIDTETDDPQLDGSSDNASLFEFEPVDHQDDLKQLFGIGPVTEKALNDLGITSYSQLADLKTHEIEKIATALSIVPGRIERDDWVGNARRQLEDVLEEL